MLSLESLVAQNPDSFPGLKPGSPPWDEIVEAYAAYWETVCGRPGEEEFLETLASAYRTELSPAQMEAAIRFYSGEDGRKLIAAGKIAASQALMAYSRAYSEQVPIAWGKFNRRVQAIFENSVRPDTKPDTK
jgi:hypothetical protein